jgi:hypothetical protein
VRDSPADPAGMNSCAACHSRRSTLSEARKAGAPLEDSHRLAMLTAPNYHADGQQREEVYVWGSFLQSKMHQNGVTCMDCHEPHSQKLRAEAMRCARAATMPPSSTPPAHHHHQAGGKGAQCVTCHMPTQNYMVIHARQDHSLRVPRPDLSHRSAARMPVPSAMPTSKPAGRPAPWTNGTARPGASARSYGTTLHAGETQRRRALPGLLELASSPARRPSSGRRRRRWPSPTPIPARCRRRVRCSRMPIPSVRIAALGMLAPVDALNRVLAAAPLLSDPVRGVRIEAANLLADVPDSQIPEGSARSRAGRLAGIRGGAGTGGRLAGGQCQSRQPAPAPGAWRRGGCRLPAGDQLDPNFGRAYVNLADAWRQQGRESEAEKVVARGLAVLPRNADLHHALGLLLTRKGDKRRR